MEFWKGNIIFWGKIIDTQIFNAADILCHKVVEGIIFGNVFEEGGAVMC